MAREPMVTFVLLGGLIFLAYEWLGEAPENAIVVSPEIISTIVNEQELLLGRPLSEPELSRLIERFVDEETLVRLAYMNGLDRGDGRVRARLITKMKLMLFADAPEPSQDELAAYYEANRERYESSFSAQQLQQYLLEDWTADWQQERLRQELRALRDAHHMTVFIQHSNDPETSPP